MINQTAPVFPILFQNDEIIAVCKPEGLASIPERQKEKQNLLYLLKPLFDEKLFVVHRLDKDVSGVILFARNAEMHRYLNERFESRQVRKTYVALTHGIITENNGIIEKSIRQFGSGRMGIDLEKGKSCLTEYEVIERFKAHTFLHMHPLIGRRHQIRVHLFSIGHPVVGDKMYGDKSLQKEYPRLMLHAQRIEFRLPSGEQANIEAPAAESFNYMLTRSLDPHMET